MEKSYENKLLLLIKLVPITIILVFTFVNITLSIQQNDKEYKKTIDTLQTELMQKAKQRAKDEVLNVYDLIKFQKSTTEKRLRESIKNRVYEAHAIATRIYNENKEKDKKTIIKMIKDALVDIRFNNGRGYFYIYSLDFECILFPLKRSIEGSSFYNFQDVKGKYLTRDIISQVKQQKEGFMNWYFYKPEDKDTHYRKIGFNKHFEPLNWFIGTGEYLKDFEEDLKKQLIERINAIRYADNGYIFMYKYDGETLSHIKKERLGTNRFYVQDKQGYFRVQGIINGAKAGGKFIEYVGSIRPTTGKPAHKISFVKGFDEWQWAFGTGVYIDEINELIEKRMIEVQEENNKEIQNILLINTILSVIFIIIAFILANKIQKIFLRYKSQMEENYKTMHEQSKNASMGEMIGNIAHQWRQPLSIISSAATGMLVQKQFNKLVDEDFEKNCNSINDNAQYLSKTIDDFKNFIKNERIFVEFNLSETIDTFLNLTTPSFKRHNIELILDLDDTIQLKGYPNELVQCFMNIFNNAKDAIKESKQSNRYIFLTTYKDKNTVVIEFKDTGGGIPDNVINRIFEPYFTTKHQSQGTGLGLSMTYNLITDGMKGLIQVSNKTYKYNGTEYKGAKFKITLPLEKE